MAPAQLPAAASDRLDADEAASQSVGELCQALLTSAEDNGLPVTFFANLIWQESRVRHDAVSPVGALGIAQFMPQAALEAGVGDPFDPRQAIPASARLLHVLREHFGNLRFAAAAYNAGAHRVSEWLDHRRALPREARNYVERITGRSVERGEKLRWLTPNSPSRGRCHAASCRPTPTWSIRGGNRRVCWSKSKSCSRRKHARKQRFIRSRKRLNRKSGSDKKSLIHKRSRRKPPCKACGKNGRYARCRRRASPRPRRRLCHSITYYRSQLPQQAQRRAPAARTA